MNQHTVIYFNQQQQHQQKMEANAENRCYVLCTPSPTARNFLLTRQT